MIPIFIPGAYEPGPISRRIGAALLNMIGLGDSDAGPSPWKPEPAAPHAPAIDPGQALTTLEEGGCGFSDDDRQNIWRASLDLAQAFAASRGATGNFWLAQAIDELARRIGITGGYEAIEVIVGLRNLENWIGLFPLGFGYLSGYSLLHSGWQDSDAEFVERVLPMVLASTIKVDLSGEGPQTS